MSKGVSLRHIQFLTILFGTLTVLFLASNGMDFFKTGGTKTHAQEFYAPDPNNPDGAPIRLTGELTSYDVPFPDMDGADYSKDAISKAIFRNIRTGSELVLGLLYERLAYLEFKDGNYPKARLAYNSALEFYVEGNQRLRAAELLSQLAHLEAKLENYDLAREHYENAAKLYALLNEPVRSDYSQKIADRLPTI